MSRGRSHTIGQETLRLFPSLTLVVDEAERDDYAGLVPEERLFTHPGLSPAIEIAIWIMERFADDDLCFVGDDHVGLYAMPGWSQRRYDDPEVALAVVENAAQCARDAGAAVFGFAANANPIVYEPYKPIHLSRWVASPFGILKGHGLECDRRLTLMDDVDFCRQSLLKHRIIWCDRRWAFVGKALNNTGGNARFRSPEAFQREQAILKEKWGNYIRFDTEALHSSKRYKQGLPATTMMTYVYVPRTQPAF